MSTHNFQKSYSVLGVFHDDDWETIRAAYKRQIRRWHPDKFQDPDQKTIAELKSRELNQAFQLLDDYYRENGALPTEESHLGTTPPSTGTAHKSSFDVTTPPSQFRQAASISTAGVNTTPQHRGRKRMFLLVVAILVGYFLFEPQLGSEQPGQLSDHQFGAPLPVTTPYPETNDSPDPYQAVTRMDTADSTSAGSDIPVQGSETDGLITIGSTKKEVLKIQGAPFRQTEASWEYGLSRIDFRNGRVVGWHESPMNPLLVKR